jgi:uncharacterized protein YlxW (UPF0749 family)
MSHVMVDGRVLTDAERIKFAADMETEEVSLERASRILELGILLKSLRKERNQLEARIGNLQAEFDALTAEVAS